MTLIDYRRKGFAKVSIVTQLNTRCFATSCGKETCLYKTSFWKLNPIIPNFHTSNKPLNFKLKIHLLNHLWIWALLNKLLVLSWLNDFMICSVHFNVQSEGSVSQLWDTVRG